ncbi:hypothetical protein [Anaerotalea alkaliphila]|uniref:Type 4 fimbrial biogenesis protein PilX N-terminal domain-containing protein n=1 Tax=Anaerotalea alkaliphila TaxID=2662126 RepID=A0A7X5HT36_9FIRM|nr:hypothetical protein [Anaerotalea alkaliphila]NDL66173.1 hypothetical protein [Anaerotalea alkaliphila]
MKRKLLQEERGATSVLVVLLLVVVLLLGVSALTTAKAGLVLAEKNRAHLEELGELELEGERLLFEAEAMGDPGGDGRILLEAFSQERSGRRLEVEANWEEGGYRLVRWQVMQEPWDYEGGIEYENPDF